MLSQTLTYQLPLLSSECYFTTRVPTLGTSCRPFSVQWQTVMAAQASATTGILSLPDEILSAIFALRDKWDWGSFPRYPQAYSLRLTCRRFYRLSNHLIVRRKTTVDISRPETLARLRTIAENPILAAGLIKVNVRLHFYHPWVAASFDNFTSSVISEWQQRRQNWGVGFATFDPISFQEILSRLLDQLDTADEREDEVYETEEGAPSANSAPSPRKIMCRAYDVYKKGFEAQNLLLSNGKFEQELAKTISKLPNVRGLALHDVDPKINCEPGRDIIAIPRDDIRAQEEALVMVLSRPMVWEDARWIMPQGDIWPGVPINLLVTIPLAIANVGGVVLEYIGILVSAAPDYTLLDLDTNRLDQLSAAVRAMQLSYFRFRPRCYQACGPWEVDDQGTTVFANRTLGELNCINQYLGAFLAAKCIRHVEIHLQDFWVSAGTSIRAAPTSLGAAFSWPLGSELAYISLKAACLVDEELEGLARSLLPDSVIELQDIQLLAGSWIDAIDTLRQELRSPRHVRIRFRLDGDEGYTYFERQLRLAFERGGLFGDSLVERFVKGEDIDFADPLHF